MTSIYFKPKSYSISRTGLEVYRTDEVNFKPYVSSGVVDTGSSSSESDGDSTSLGYDYHQGKLLDTYYYGQLQKTSHESDYKEMNNNGSVTVNSIDRERFYKGVKVKLLKEWEADGKTLDWENDLKPVLDGFITEQTFSEDGVEIKVSGDTVLLDQKFQFEFTSMKRSKILEEIIKTAGLIPVINTKGLDDDVTDFKTSSSDSSSSSGATGGEGEDIDAFVKKTIGNETDDLKKLKKLHSALVSKIKYTGYECTRYDTPSKCLSSCKLNCADSARLASACYRSAGLKCYVIHGDYHFWVIVTINGKDYASDVSGNHDLNEVWHTSAHPNTPFKGKNCGDNPDC